MFDTWKDAGAAPDGIDWVLWRKTVLYRLLLLVLFVVAGCTSTPPRNGIRYDVDIDGAGWSLGRAIEEVGSGLQVSGCSAFDRRAAEIPHAAG